MAVNHDAIIQKVAIKLSEGSTRKFIEDYFAKHKPEVAPSEVKIILDAAEKLAAPPPPADALQLEAAIIAMVEEMDADFGALPLDEDERETTEFWIKSRITDKALNVFNDSLAKQNRRRLTYEDLAIMALIHKASVEENEGYSMFKRFVNYSQAENSLLKPLSNAHVARAIKLFEQIGFTKKIAEHDAKSHLPARYVLTATP
ncbi:MAG TPA: hypothetical protein VG326_12215 [Tepidisphaeraceae bacterium]|jgi:hypothetical protein|nr:hypothetical protein [Tepidisphaeraceae bacterium]